MGKYISDRRFLFSILVVSIQTCRCGDEKMSDVKFVAIIQQRNDFKMQLITSAEG